MRLVLATHNAAKAREMREVLEGLDGRLEVGSLADYPGAPEPEEVGGTYRENAAIKALSAGRFTGEWSLADDAGLEIDALGGAPGHHSRRFAGEDTPFVEKMRLILERLDGVPEDRRAARFRCCVALAPPGGEGEPHVFEAVCDGRIARAPSGTGGFGYDPIFWLTELGCTMADLTAEQKHAVSHRGKVLRQFAEWLRTTGPAFSGR